MFKYGYGDCYDNAEVQAIGTTDTYTTCDGDSDIDHPGQVRWGDPGDAAPGDSGTITFGADPDEDGYYACSMVNGISGWYQPERFARYVTGVGGYYMDNNYGWYWS